MALLMVQEGVQPAGQYDNLDGYAPAGGEVYVLYSKGVDAGGFQVVAARPAVTGDANAFYLVDDGLTGYGVLFGNTVTRTATGFASGADNGARLGPSTHAASGKLTLWDKPGLYAVTLDALKDSEASLKAALPGAALTCESGTGKLKLGTMGAGAALASVVAFKVDEALVTTGGSVTKHKKLVINFSGNAGTV